MSMSRLLHSSLTPSHIRGNVEKAILWAILQISLCFSAKSRKTRRVFRTARQVCQCWQKRSIWRWMRSSDMIIVSGLPTLFSLTYCCTQSSLPMGTPATNRPVVEMPASMPGTTETSELRIGLQRERMLQVIHQQEEKAIMIHETLGS